MNIHIKACRKNVWGTTYYNPSAVDYSVVPDGEVAARVSIKAQGFNKDIRTLVYHEAATLDTKQTLGDMQGVMDLTNQFFPTQRSEEHTSELQSLMRISYAVFCLKKKKKTKNYRQ